MPRYRLTLEYDGGPYKGWQYQEHCPSVQGALEIAISKLCGAHIRTQVAGRTDAGVHALGQVVHVDLPKNYAADKVRTALNFYLMEERVAVLHSEKVTEEFHARFSATGRRYLYRILNRPSVPAVERGRVWHVPEALDITLMEKGARHLLGTHDFTSFRASECQAKSPIRTLDEITIERVGEEIHLRFAARSFLHHQVRNIVGSLKKVGQGRWKPEKIKQVLEARSRAAADMTAPAEGLYLTEVIYGK